MNQQERKKKAWEKNSEMYHKLLEECDFEGAKEYAKKLNGDTAAAEVEFLQKFYTLYETGDWQAAIDAFDSDGREWESDHIKKVLQMLRKKLWRLVPMVVRFP